MHFEPEKGHGTYSVIELRTDTKLAAVIRATNGGISIDVAQGFDISADSEINQREIHIEIRERES